MATPITPLRVRPGRRDDNRPLTLADLRDTRPPTVLEVGVSSPCDWCCEIGNMYPPRPARWVATTKKFPCPHLVSTWSVCGHCLGVAITGKRPGDAPQQIWGVSHCPGYGMPLKEWLVSYRPIEQPRPGSVTWDGNR